MADVKRSPRPRFSEYLMPAGLRKRLAPDTQQVAAAWEKFRETGDIQARNALTEHYAPLAMIAAARMKRRRPDYYSEALDEIVSDGLLGLLRGIEALPFYDERTIRGYLEMVIRCTISREKRYRTWIGRRGCEQLSVVKRMREQLTREHGRVPSPQEMSQALAGLVNNPDIQSGEPRNIMPASQGREAKSGLRCAADTREDRPERREMNREVMRLAARGLGADDRKLLRMVLAGASKLEIAGRMGVVAATAHRRINGLLWTLRCRSDLAAYLGVEPATGERPIGSVGRRGRPVIRLSDGKRFETMSSAAASIGVVHSSLQEQMDRKRPIGGSLWRYADARDNAPAALAG